MKTTLAILVVLGALAASSYLLLQSPASPSTVEDIEAHTAAVANVAPYSAIIDNTDVAHTRKTGAWKFDTYLKNYYNANYSLKVGEAAGQTFTFFTKLPTTGVYEVFARWVSSEERATSVPVVIAHASGTAEKRVNMRMKGGQWVSLGSFTFSNRFSAWKFGK